MKALMQVLLGKNIIDLQAALGISISTQALDLPQLNG
jgi:hypothetical protein